MPATNTIDELPPIAGEKMHPCILVVDDDESVRHSLGIVLSDDYDVIEASSGSEALQLISSLHFDATILDICMPVLDGCETLERIKLLSPESEVIMLTAHESLDSAKKAVRMGACDYLSKPFELDEIRAAVRNAIERRHKSERIRNRVIQLNDYREDLEIERIQARMAEARSQVYASVIHDINGPLTVISGFASILSDTIKAASQIKGEDLETTRNYIDRIRFQVESCVRVSQRYLGYYRDKRDQQNTAKRNQALEDVRELISSHPANGENHLIFTPLNSEAIAQINGADLIQILINLSINALQSSPDPHTVHLEAALSRHVPDWSRFDNELEVRRVVCGTPPSDGPIAIFTVRDNGDGIPQSILDQMFQRQFTTKGARKGTGLGLAIIKRMMEEAGGAIEVRSTVGKGSTFNLYLPLA